MCFSRWTSLLETRSDKCACCGLLLLHGFRLRTRGVGHQTTETTEQFWNFNFIIGIVGVLVLIGNAALMRIGIAFFTESRVINIVWAFLHLSGMIAAFTLAVSEPGRTGVDDAGIVLVAFVIPTSVGMIIIFSVMARKLKASKKNMEVFIFRALAMLQLQLIGFVIQVSFGGVCGIGGYEDCFEECPLPDPANFNHNAIFQILVAANS